MVSVAFALEVWLRSLTALPPAAWEEPVLVVALARRLLEPRPASVLLILTLCAAAAVAARRRSTGPAWTDIAHGAWLRGLAVVAALLLAWGLATAPFNFHFGRTHGIDRVLLVVLVPAIAWRPVALVPFVLLVLTVTGPLTHPIGGYSQAAANLPLRIVLLTTAFWLVRGVNVRVRTADLFFLVCCLVAAHLFASGRAKLALGWAWDDQVALLLPNTYAGGWLAFLDGDTIGGLTGTLGRFNGLMRAATLLLEVGALAALARRNILRAFLAGWIGMHAVIFLVSGILFWDWVVLEAALLVMLSRRAPDWGIFTRPHFALSIVVIGGGVLWFRPDPLAWLDSPVNYAYRFRAATAGGLVHLLSPGDFAPYRYQFTVGDFAYLVDAPTLPIAWGAMRDPALRDSLEAARSAEEVMGIEARLGITRFDSARAATFDAFVRRYVRTRNARAGDAGWWRVLAAPPRLWTFRSGPPPAPDDPIERITVEHVTTWFDGRRYREIRVRPVRVIDVSP